MSGERSKKLPWLMLVPAIAVLLVLGVFPLIYSAWLSLHSYSLLDPSRGINYVGGENFLNTLTSGHPLGISFPKSLWLTLIYLGGCLAGEVGIGLLAAMLFSGEHRTGLRSLRILMMMPMLLAPVVVGNIWRYMYQYSFGLLNFLLRTVGLPAPEWLARPTWAMISLIMADVWEWIPFSFLVLLAAILSIPQDQWEAANIDGAGAWQRFRYIMLPWTKHAFLVIILIRGIDLIRVMDLPYVITYGGPAVSTSVLPFNAYMLGFRYFEIGHAAAYAYLMLALINVFVILFINVLRRRPENA